MSNGCKRPKSDVWFGFRWVHYSVLATTRGSSMADRSRIESLEALRASGMISLDTVTFHVGVESVGGSAYVGRLLLRRCLRRLFRL